MKTRHILIAVIGLAATLVGCQQDTNVITPESVEAANKHRIEVIDKDPNMTPEQRQKMKEMLRLVPKQGDDKMKR
ncbi:MAG: hypothetical protein JSS65_04220 [Armatimonadetes bacterium]|nr:hypothetical protein [Armatimonadota bacterium]